ncbi:universal stress protein [Rhodoferax lacus]|nr:universal stress protein [Rhodoferax lacus]
MFKKLLVPVDGSPTSKAALMTAIDMAKVLGASMTVVSVYDPFPFIVAGPDYGYAQMQYVDAVRTETKNTVDAARKLAADAGLTVEGLVVDASKTWRAILDTVQGTASDLIVMGSHGRSGLDKLVMGSVAQSVLQHSPVAVLVVRG